MARIKCKLGLVVSLKKVRDKKKEERREAAIKKAIDYSNKLNW